MKITDLLLEQPGPSKAIINSILINSGVENSPSRDQIVNDITTKYYPRFKQIQNGLKLGIPQVDTFLRHFSGDHDTIKFESDLKDITKYNIEQLKFLIGEYTTEPQDGDDVSQNSELLSKTKFNEETAEISKKLWYDEPSAKINLPGFRVYQPMNQSDAVKFGWYEEKLMNELRPGWHAWCITWRSGSNRWGSYRKDGGTFYFVIDESKFESEDTEVKKYYLCAIQVFSKERYHATGYEITDIKNPGEVGKTWGEIVAIYPQLSEYKDVLQPLKFSNNELEAQNTVAKINEREGDMYEFSRMDRVYKKQYIDAMLKIQKPNSWDFMDQKLRELYIVLTPAGDFRNRFPNFEILRAVKKYGLGKLLNDEMIKKDRNEGIKSLSEYLNKDLRLQEERAGIVNESIILYKTIQKKYGLWNNITSDWLEKNGNVYDPSYDKIEEEIIENPKTKERFYVDKYSTNDNDYFVAITPLLDVDSYFLSKNAWEGIKDKFKTEGTELDADTAQDINEFKKGL
jgi:hypothetical protein